VYKKVTNEAANNGQENNPKKHRVHFLRESCQNTNAGNKKPHFASGTNVDRNKSPIKRFGKTIKGGLNIINGVTKGRSKLRKPLKDFDCIQDDMKCDCIAKTPKGVEYHPSLKAVYERRGAKGIFVKVGLRCPKCGKYINLDQKPLT